MAGSQSPTHGFSLIEVLVAMMLLLITITVIGSGLTGALRLERQTKERRAAGPLAEWITARHSEGIPPDTIAEELEAAHPDALVQYQTVPAVDESLWDHWTLQASPDAPRLALDLRSHPPPSE